MFFDAECMFFPSPAFSLLRVVFLGRRVRAEEGITRSWMLTIKDRN